MRWRWRAMAVVAVAAGVACTSAAGDGGRSARPVASMTETTTTEAAGAPVEAAAAAAPAEPTATTTSPASVAAEAPAPPPPPPTTTTTEAPRPGPRLVVEQDYLPFAVAGGAVTLRHPARRVERVGFHQSTHDGAREMAVLPTGANAVTLESRERGTTANSAADVVVDPAGEIRAPVSGTVKRGGRYVLYCDHYDHYLVIEPDDRPGWEVKVLHLSSADVGTGDRVTAGETVIANGPTQLPFESQVDELRTQDPAWPHVHIEVVDPTIRDRPTPGGGCP